jgi:replicative DNA helicase Mcm
MEQQTVTISKANVQASLRAETSVLAAGNPKYGRFDPYSPIASQVDIQPTLLNRFDVIFMLRDVPNKNKDEAIATHILEEHKDTSKRGSIEPELFRKYVAYAKQKVTPKLTDEAVAEIKNFYVKLRNSHTVTEGNVKSIPITARQLTALVRLSEAAAKSHLAEFVEVRDAQVAIKIMKYYLTQVGFDEDTKSFDIDKIVSGVTASKRGKIMEVKNTLVDLESKLGKLIPKEELEKAIGDKLTKPELDEVLTKLSISGDIFSPKRGFIQLV